MMMRLMRVRQMSTARRGGMVVVKLVRATMKGGNAVSRRPWTLRKGWQAWWRVNLYQESQYVMVKTKLTLELQSQEGRYLY